MRCFSRSLARFVRGDSGVEPVQYAVALALIIVAVIGGLRLLGNASNSQNNATSSYLQNAATPRSSGS